MCYGCSAQGERQIMRVVDRAWRCLMDRRNSLSYNARSRATGKTPRTNIIKGKSFTYCCIRHRTRGIVGPWLPVRLFRGSNCHFLMMKLPLPTNRHHTCMYDQQHNTYECMLVFICTYVYDCYCFRTLILLLLLSQLTLNTYGTSLQYAAARGGDAIELSFPWYPTFVTAVSYCRILTCEPVLCYLCTQLC